MFTLNPFNHHMFKSIRMDAWDQKLTNNTCMHIISCMIEKLIIKQQWDKYDA